MSTEDEEKRLLERMLPIQLGKLRANAHKDHWAMELRFKSTSREERAARISILFSLLQGEVTELQREIADAANKMHPAVGRMALANAGKIRAECADIMNVAAMIADIAGDDSPDP